MSQNLGAAKWLGTLALATCYSIAYFIIYAVQNVQSHKLMDAPLSNSCMQLALAAICMAHGISRREQFLALVSVGLAFVTLSMPPTPLFATSAIVLVCVASSAVCVGMKWLEALFVSAVGSYCIFAAFTQTHVFTMAPGLGAAVSISIGYITLFWLACTVALIAIGHDTSQSHYKSSMTAAANTATFAVFGALFMFPLFLDWLRIFTIATAGACVLAAKASAWRGQRTLTGTFTALTVVFSMLAIFMWVKS